MSPASERPREDYVEKFTHQQNLDQFVHRQNLERFQKLIDESTGETPDKQLLKLQAEEVAKDYLAAQNE
jgi:ABC-type proline/glycine betaine transport system ATPase subunit